MTEIQKLQKISKGLRYLVILITIAVIAAVTIAQLVYGKLIVSFDNDELNALWHNPYISKVGLYSLTAPILLFAALSIYWLQRLFGEYQRGEFFTPNNMKCYLWLIWLRVGHFLYYLALPYLFQLLPDAPANKDYTLSLDVSAFFNLLLLVCIIYVLKTAHKINQENKEFV
jgi:hypothetical protein